jgi:TonB dependent receptor
LTADGAYATFGSVRWRYFGPRPLTEDGSAWSRHTSLVNAQAGYRLSRRYSIVVDAFNLLNARHSDVDYFYTSRLARRADERGGGRPHAPGTAPHGASDLLGGVLTPGRPREFILKRGLHV